MVGTTNDSGRVNFALSFFALTAASLWLVSCCGTSAADEPPVLNELQRATPVSGTLMICGGGYLPPAFVDRFFELSGGKNARIVIVTTASIAAGTPDIEARYSGWIERPHASVEFFHTRSRDDADNPAFCESLKTATGLWFVGGNQNWVAESYLGTYAEAMFHKVLERGGVIGGTSAGAAIMSRQMIAGGKSEPMMATGFGFLPGVIVDQHYRKRNRRDRLMQALELRPGRVGIGIDEATALVVHGRSMEVIGESDVTLCLAPSAQRSASEVCLVAGGKEDLIKLSRAAIARTQTVLASTEKPIPEVKQGTLVIVGGGSTPREAVDEFLLAAGGKDAPILVVSDALDGDAPEEQKVCEWLKDAGAHNVRQLDARTLSDSVDPDRLRQARGVWFTGGRQWRLVDAYLDTPALKLFHEVLRRGGVIGGSSAGATIQGEYLVRGNPLGNEDMMAEGYERGFGFLPGVAIDQHFSQRDRFEDMTELKKVHPQLVGIGIDEATAMIVRGTTMEVVGKNSVAIYDRVPEVTQSGRDFEVIKAGQKYDFKQHRMMDTAALQSADTK